MIRRLAVQTAGIVGAVALFAAFTAGPAGAEVTGVDPTNCPSAHVCIFNGPNFTLFSIQQPTKSQCASQQWCPIRGGGMDVPWGSWVNNSGSSLVFGNASTNQTQCFGENLQDATPPASLRAYGYFHVEYGEHHCGGTIPPLP